MKYSYGKKPALRTAVTESGIVKGAPGNNRNFTVFKGIPYAAPPVGELRWKAPQPVTPWDGVRECTHFSKVPFQFSPNGAEDGRALGEEGEDCLYINVWTPAQSPDEKLPVLFWNFGGGFTGGSVQSDGKYDGEGFCKRGVILVSFNYRTGPLGFFAHEDLEKESPDGTSSNYYYLDQIAALKWTKRNIAAFGGDPERITIMGHSSGACSATVLTCSPKTRDDIAGSILLSASLMSDFDNPAPVFTTREEAMKLTKEFMNMCGCETLKEMRALPAETLRDVAVANHLMAFFWLGIIDGHIITDKPGMMFRKGQYNNIPFIVGSTVDEENKIVGYGNGYDNLLTREKVSTYAEHFGDQAEDFVKLCDSLSDSDLYTSLLNTGSYRNRLLAELNLRNNKKPVYVYSFRRRMPGDQSGAFHGSDLGYIFSTLQRDWRPYTGADYDLSELMADYFANFVRSGDPNVPEMLHWAPFDKEHTEVMNFDTAPFMSERKISEVQKYKINYLIDHPEAPSII